MRGRRVSDLMCTRTDPDEKRRGKTKTKMGDENRYTDDEDFRQSA